MMLCRAGMLTVVCLLTACDLRPIHAAETLDPAKAKSSADGALLWYDLKSLPIEGQGFSDVKAPYDRLPGKAEGVVPPGVWGLSRHSTGLCARFVCDAPTIHARWTLISPNLAMPHMPATGVSGLDLYFKTADGGWRWLANGRPGAATNEVTLVSGLPAGEREYLLYLPLYNGVSSVELGIPKANKLAKAEPRPAGRERPILFYGTSITQGGCASRPGMVHTAILGRKFDWSVINLGFSGSGKMEPAMATLMAELDPAVYVLDCLPNMDAKTVTERVEPFVQTLRKAHPQTPIVLVEDRFYDDTFLLAGKRQGNEANHAALRAVYERLLAAGVKGLHYRPADHLLGDDGEATVDSSHPNDLGFMRQAEAFAPVLKPLLK